MEQKKKKPSEFDNFRNLTNNLIAVPKKEIDKQKVAYENQKNKKEKPAK